jgi:hypothetical protein
VASAPPAAPLLTPDVPVTARRARQGALDPRQIGVPSSPLRWPAACKSLGMRERTMELDGLRRLADLLRQAAVAAGEAAPTGGKGGAAVKKLRRDKRTPPPVVAASPR